MRKSSERSNMTQEDKSLEEFLHDLLEQEKKRHEESLKQHNELMQMIENVRKGMEHDGE
jgi:hypothetical protein